MKVRSFIFIAIVGLLLTDSGFAGPRSGGGGDPIGIEFLQIATEAAERIMGENTSVLRGINLKRILKTTKILVIDKPLKVIKDGVVQNSAAMNIKRPRTIIINRDAWSNFTSYALRSALATHELLSLAGLEDTGLYNSTLDLLASAQYQRAVVHCGLVKEAKLDADKNVWFKALLVYEYQGQVSDYEYTDTMPGKYIALALAAVNQKDLKLCITKPEPGVTEIKYAAWIQRKGDESSSEDNVGSH